MQQVVKLENELDELNKVPQYIDLFCKVMKQKLGGNREQVEEAIQVAQAYYKESEYPNVYGKLLVLEMEYHLLYGMLSEAVELGERALLFCKEHQAIHEMIQIENQLLRAYMEKGLFEKALTYMIELKKEEKYKEEQILHIQFLLITANLYIMVKAYAKAEVVLIHIKSMEEGLTPNEQLQVDMLLLEVYIEQDKLEKAIDYGQRAYNSVNLFDDESHKYLLVKILRLRARLNSKRKLKMQPEKDFAAAARLGIEYKTVYVDNLVSWSEYLLEEMSQELNQLASQSELTGDEPRTSPMLFSETKLEEIQEKITVAVQKAEEMESVYYLEKAYKVLVKFYEITSQEQLVQETLKKAYKYEKALQYDKALLQALPKETNHLREESEVYHKAYEELQKVTTIGKAFTKQLTAENLQEVIQKELASVIDIDMMGIAVIQNGKTQYTMYDLKGKWLSLENDLVEYTSRLAEYCIQYQTNLIINDGNFEEYSLKTIKNSETDVKLNSMIVRVLKVENQVIGAMSIGSYKQGAYSVKHIEMAKIIASYLGLTLKNTSLYNEMTYLTDHDLLTGLLHRSVVLKNGEALFKKNHKQHKNTAIIMLDTDLLKQINKKYGHQLGDEVLSKIGKIIKENVREEDYVGRYGGEEFIVILNHLSQTEVMQVAERIKTSVEKLSFETKKDKNIKVTLSGGIYICNEYTLNFEDAIRFADHALYRAKLLGRNHIVSYNFSDRK